MRFATTSRLLALAFALCFAAPAVGQPTDQALNEEIEALKQGQEEILKQLAELKKLVQSRPAAAARARGSRVAGQVFDVRDNPVKGVDTAKLTLVEFTDYQ